MPWPDRVSETREKKGFARHCVGEIINREVTPITARSVFSLKDCRTRERRTGKKFLARDAPDQRVGRAWPKPDGYDPTSETRFDARLPLLLSHRRFREFLDPRFQQRGASQRKLKRAKSVHAFADVAIAN